VGIGDETDGIQTNESSTAVSYFADKWGRRTAIGLVSTIRLFSAPVSDAGRLLRLFYYQELYLLGLSMLACSLRFDSSMARGKLYEKHAKKCRVLTSQRIHDTLGCPNLDE
jgi:hypothetical protein